MMCKFYVLSYVTYSIYNNIQTDIIYFVESYCSILNKTFARVRKLEKIKENQNYRVM